MDQNIDSIQQSITTKSLQLSSSLVSFGRGLPSLFRKLVEQIKSNQYVDFVDLPPALHCTFQSITGEGQITFIQAADIADTIDILHL